MKKIYLVLVLMMMGFVASHKVQAQNQDSLIRAQFKTYKVAVFTPLFLDSAFSGNSYRYAKSYPKFSMSGFDFALGAKMALDSLPIVNGNVNATIFDSKSATMPITRLIATNALNDFNLIIGSVKDAEYQQLAAFANKMKIPFISATYPNDGGITGNPYLAIASPTLKAHCEAIYSYMLQTANNANIVVARKNGSQEDKIVNILTESNSPDGNKLLQLKTVNFSEDFSGLANLLDSTRNNILVGASLSEAFATSLVSQAAALTGTYAITLIGMPNWDGFRLARKNDAAKDFPFYFTTPFSTGSNFHYRRVNNEYRSKFKTDATDIVLKAYEIVYQYAKMLPWQNGNFMEGMNNYPYKIFTDFNFKPVYGTDGTTIDYYENKRLYLMKVLNGEQSKVW